MKKRRIVILSFILVAVLTIGVGFATVADTLLIKGDFNFRNASEIIGSKDAAIKFTQVVSTTPEENAVGAVSVTAGITNDDVASLNVAINGVTTDQPSASYTATAVYKVVYETDDTTLDPVYVSATPEGSALSITGLTVTVDTSKDILAVGEDMEVTVIVTYTPVADVNNSGEEITDVFDIKLEFSDTAPTTP